MDNKAFEQLEADSQKPFQEKLADDLKVKTIEKTEMPSDEQLYVHHLNECEITWMKETLTWSLAQKLNSQNKMDFWNGMFYLGGTVMNAASKIDDPMAPGPKPVCYTVKEQINFVNCPIFYDCMLHDTFLTLDAPYTLCMGG